jgi:hypothetical protein
LEARPLKVNDPALLMLILASAPSAGERVLWAVLRSVAAVDSDRPISRSAHRPQGGRGLLAASNLVIATGLLILAAAWLLMNASQVSRCACSDLNS